MLIKTSGGLISKNQKLHTKFGHLRLNLEQTGTGKGRKVEKVGGYLRRQETKDA